MSFYQQPNDWTCGPFALKHALVALGLFAGEGRLTRLAKTHWWAGTSELGLSRAAEEFGVGLELVRKYDEESARRALLAQLNRKLPALLCVDDWGHWITVLRHQRGELVIVDSNLDPVLNVLSWRQLLARWRYYDTDYSEEAPPLLLDIMMLRPRTRISMRGDFSPTRVRFLRRAANAGLAQSWDAYVTDLAAICRPKHQQMTEPLSMAEFLRRNGHQIASRVSYWHGGFDDKAISKLLGTLQFVAETYGLVIRKNDSKSALVDLTALATLWAASRDPVDEFY